MLTAGMTVREKVVEVVGRANAKVQMYNDSRGLCAYLLPGYLYSSHLIPDHSLLPYPFCCLAPLPCTQVDYIKMQHEYFDDILKKLQMVPGHRETAEPVKVTCQMRIPSSVSAAFVCVGVRSLAVCMYASLAAGLECRCCRTSRLRWRLWQGVKRSRGQRQRRCSGDSGRPQSRGELKGGASR